MMIDEQSPFSPTSPLGMIEFCTQPLESDSMNISTIIKEIALQQLQLSVQEKERASSYQSSAKSTVTTQKSSMRSRSSSSSPINIDQTSNERDDNSGIIQFQLKRSESIYRTRPRRTLSNNDLMKVFKQEVTPVSTTTRSRRTKRSKSDLAGATYFSGKRGSSSRSLSPSMSSGFSNMMGENSMRDLYEDMKPSHKQRSSLANARRLLSDRKSNSNTTLTSSSSHSESSTSTYCSKEDRAHSNNNDCATKREPPAVVAAPTPAPVLITNALWKCTCGFEHEDRMRFCGICGTKKHWTSMFFVVCAGSAGMAQQLL